MGKRVIFGYVCAVSSAVIYGLMPLMAKYIYEDGVNPMTLTFLRNVLALPVIALLSLKTQKTLKIPWKLLPNIALLSVLGCTVTPLLLYSSYAYIASGTATVFHFVYPAIVVVLGMLFLKGKAEPGNLISVILCVIGICLFYTPGEAFNLQGSALALGSGVTFALYVVLLPMFPSEQVHGFLFAFYVALISSVTTFAACLFSGTLALPTSLFGWGISCLLAVLVSAVAHVLFQQSTFSIGGERTAILSTMEPVTGIAVGAIVFGEPLGMRTLIGSALVILASLLITLFDARK